MDILGFDQIKLQLSNAYQSNKLHHALLLCGKKGIGKASFAKELAANLLNQKIAQPDILLIKKHEGKSIISVEQIRKIANFLNQTAAIGKNKFIIIDAADELNKAASNALLKILEEPHFNNFLILIAHQSHKLLPTIRSRCQVVKADLTEEIFQKILAKNILKYNETEIKILSEICDNSPGKALEMGRDLIETYQEFLESIFVKKIDEKLMKKISDKNFNFEYFTEVISFFIKRLGLDLQGLVKDYNFNEKDVFLSLKQKFDNEKICNLSSDILPMLSTTVTLNLDKKLTLINIFNKIVF